MPRLIHKDEENGDDERVKLDDEGYSKRQLLTFEDFDTVQLVEKDAIFVPVA